MGEILHTNGVIRNRESIGPGTCSFIQVSGDSWNLDGSPLCLEG